MTILRDLDNTNRLLYKLFVRYLIVKPACVNAALVYSFIYLPSFLGQISSKWLVVLQSSCWTCPSIQPLKGFQQHIPRKQKRTFQLGLNSIPLISLNAIQKIQNSASTKNVRERFCQIPGQPNLINCCIRFTIDSTQVSVLHWRYLCRGVGTANSLHASA